jgi:hypothetical protein
MNYDWQMDLVIAFTISLYSAAILTLMSKWMFLFPHCQLHEKLSSCSSLENVY